MTLIDTHCHLNDSNLVIPADEAIRAATEAGVTRFVVPGTDLVNSRTALELAAAHPEVCFAAVGVHPHDAVAAPTPLAELRTLAAAEGVVAIGEIGIDYHHHTRDETGAMQREAFAAQLALAVELGLPAIVHGRNAYDDVLDVIHAHPGSRGVLHSFEAPYEVAAAALDLGWIVGFTALVTYRGNDALREVVAKLPDDAFVLETDTPYLPPRTVRDRAKTEASTPGVIGARGRNNQPAYLIETAQLVAQVRRTSLEAVALATTRTAAQFFSL